MYVITNRAIMFAIRSQIIAFVICSIEILAIPQPTKRLTPRGGVDIPMARLTTMMIPK